MRLRFLILPMAAALLGTAAGAQSTPTAYWVCKLEVSVASRMGTRLTLHGQGKRRYIENNIYYASFQTRDDQGAWPAKSAAYAQGFKAAIVAAGHPVTSEGGAPGEPLCRPNPDQESAKSFERLLRTSPQGGNGVQRVY